LVRNGPAGGLPRGMLDGQVTLKDQRTLNNQENDQKQNRKDKGEFHH
jgi:hypothetical protein